MRWAGHVARMGEGRGVYRVLVGKPEGKRPLGRPRRRWEDNIKEDLKEVGGVQLLAEENFAAVPKEEWDAVCRYVKIVEVECNRRKHEKDSPMERIITSADEDDDDDNDTSHS